MPNSFATAGVRDVEAQRAQRLWVVDPPPAPKPRSPMSPRAPASRSPRHARAPAAASTSNSGPSALLADRRLPFRKIPRGAPAPPAGSPVRSDSLAASAVIQPRRSSAVPSPPLASGQRLRPSSASASPTTGITPDPPTAPSPPPESRRGGHERSGSPRCGLTVAHVPTSASCSSRHILARSLRLKSEGTTAQHCTPAPPLADAARAMGSVER